MPEYIESNDMIEFMEDKLKAWETFKKNNNTRPAPPIGRCGECKYFYKSINEKACTNPQGMYFTEITENDFCSYFEPEEEE